MPVLSAVHLAPGIGGGLMLQLLRVQVHDGLGCCHTSTQEIVTDGSEAGGLLGWQRTRTRTQTQQRRRQRRHVGMLFELDWIGLHAVHTYIHTYIHVLIAWHGMAWRATAGTATVSSPRCQAPDRKKPVFCPPARPAPAAVPRVTRVPRAPRPFLHSLAPKPGISPLGIWRNYPPTL